jgi:nucleolar protein 14
VRSTCNILHEHSGDLLKPAIPGSKMPPSQLKQLKASLRDHGLVGPQKSKKQKKAASKDGGKRLQRNAALEGIRERFNPFEVKTPARPVKFEVTSNKPSKRPGRPGVTKGLGEERRRETLLKEIHSRNKVGGILDRRFGENDPTMTPEQRAAERFAKQNERKAKKNSMFNLEDDEEEEMALTHGGEVLGMGDFNMDTKDDFEEDDIDSSDESIDYNAEDIDDRPRKRIRVNGEDQTNGLAETADQLPERKKSKAEVMKEVMAKSKLYKYERQQAKEDDDDLRAELDKDMSGIYEAMREFRSRPKPLPTPPSTDGDTAMNPERAAMLAGKDPKAIETEYNERMRQMALDARSKPSTRTKTDEEKAAEEAARLQDLERKRLKRMKGEEESSEDEIEQAPQEDDDEEQDDAEMFGIQQPGAAPVRPNLDVEDEDEFVLDDDLIASDSEVEMASDSGSEDSEAEEALAEDDGDNDFINGLVLPRTAVDGISEPSVKDSSLAYTYPCPQTHKELLSTLKGTRLSDLPIVVQRIRALYHPRLAEGNKEKLGKFAITLVKHVAYMADQAQPPEFSVVESLIRHLHSMAKTNPDAVAFGYRSRLRKISEARPLVLSNGDLMILTGISSTFPTSDHFHSVVTPAMLTIARYLGQSVIQNSHDLVVGAYCCTLALQYQGLSKRYVPEVITYITNALAALAPVPVSRNAISSPEWLVHMQAPGKSIRAGPQAGKREAAMSFESFYLDQEQLLSEAWVLILTFARLLSEASELWRAKSAFDDMFKAPMSILKHILSNECTLHMPQETCKSILSIHDSILTLQQSSVEIRKPLLLHNHRPLAIKLSIPKFEEGYNPDRHYDPDRERSDLNKLKAEHKRERKGAMRELRKDSNFIARESLREKKEKDEAHAKRERRLIAEIQGEEGHERKEYEIQKRKRKGNW